MSSCGTGVSRRRAADGTAVIWKTMRHTEWENLMYMQNQPIPVPRVISSHAEPDTESVEVCMEDVGRTHLEIVPGRFADALRLLREVRALPLAEAAVEGPNRPITLDSVHREVMQTFEVEWVVSELGCSEQEQRLLGRTFETCANFADRLQRDWLVSAHGDFHPRNILVGDDGLCAREGSLVVIDWEWAGKHSVFRDIHALIDMCYPDADAALLDEWRLSLRNQALREAEAELGLRAESLDEGYQQFLLLERLLECRNIARDLANKRRNTDKLQHQVRFVLRDLEKLLWRWISWTNLPS